MPQVFLYNLDRQKSIKIKNLCRKMNIGTRDIAPEQYGVRLSALLGLSDDLSAQEGAAFEDEMLYFVDFNGAWLNILLDQLRRQKTPVALKAVMTEANVEMTSFELYRELKAEHAALSGR